jgi:hypothetical protein
MRKLKFRAWDVYVVKPKMVTPNNGDLIGWHAPSNWEKCYKVMQYIGLDDANGKEIYEEDILTDGQDNYRVWIEDGKMLIGGLSKEWDEFISIHKVSRMKIIGNAYENPELIRVSI